MEDDNISKVGKEEEECKERERERERDAKLIYIIKNQKIFGREEKHKSI